MRIRELTRPVAITMWDFSWLERRWPGGGYADWDEALDGLVDRGYDAVRIDAYPHLIAADPDREWDLVPVWTEHAWGAPAPVRTLPVRDALIDFIERCAARHIAVGRSSWHREDKDDVRMRLSTPQAHAAA